MSGDAKTLIPDNPQNLGYVLTQAKSGMVTASVAVKSVKDAKVSLTDVDGKPVFTCPGSNDFSITAHSNAFSIELRSPKGNTQTVTVVKDGKYQFGSSPDAFHKHCEAVEAQLLEIDLKDKQTGLSK